MSYLITTLPLTTFDYNFCNFYITNKSSHTRIFIYEDSFILIEGFVYDLNLSRKLSEHEVRNLLTDYRASKSVFPEHITGQYTIIYIADNEIDVLTDFVGMKPLYYHFEKEIYITNNIYGLIRFGFMLDRIALFQSMVAILNIPLNSRSLLKDIKSLRGGEYISYNVITKTLYSTVDSMKMENARINESDVSEFVSMLQNNAGIYSEIFKKVTLPISAGVDSRITLSSFKNIDQNFNLISYGEKDYIDNKIAKKIADFVELPHTNVSFKDHLFPTDEEFGRMIQNGGEFFIGAWFPVIRELKSNEKYFDSVVLLGDVLDTLRAKNVKSIRSRSNRISYQLNNLVGKQVKLEPLDVDSFALIQKSLYKAKIEQLFDAYPELFDHLSYNSSDFIKETNADIDSFLAYTLKKFSPKNQANLEEAFYVTTWGAKTMAKQINVFKGEFESYVLMATRHVVKQVLNFSPIDRFEDKLTHVLLKKKGFSSYSHFPTSQIPFVPYKANIYLKYAVWGFRSGIDQILIKLGKGRLVKHIEWQQYYKNSANKILIEQLLAEVDPKLKILPLDLFNKRASGEYWPLTEVDINTYCFLFKLKYLK